MPCALAVGEGIDAKIVAETSGSRPSRENPAGAATNTITNSNTTKMSSTLDHVPVRRCTSRHANSPHSPPALRSYSPPAQQTTPPAHRQLRSCSRGSQQLPVPNPSPNHSPEPTLDLLCTPQPDTPLALRAVSLPPSPAHHLSLSGACTSARHTCSPPRAVSVCPLPPAHSLSLSLLTYSSPARSPAPAHQTSLIVFITTLNRLIPKTIATRFAGVHHFSGCPLLIYMLLSRS